MDRRRFLTAAGAAAVLARVRLSGSGQPGGGAARFRTGLVAYSYRDALKAGILKYEDLVRIAVETGTDGLDMTVYWLPSTSADYLRGLRRLAYRNRVEIYSIGTRVQLAQPAENHDAALEVIRRPRRVLLLLELLVLCRHRLRLL